MDNSIYRIWASQYAMSHDRLLATCTLLVRQGWGFLRPYVGEPFLLESVYFPLLLLRVIFLNFWPYKTAEENVPL